MTTHDRRGTAIALIVDAGPLYAYVDRDDRHHAASLELLETHPGPLVVPTLVITEVTYLLGTRLGDLTLLPWNRAAAVECNRAKSHDTWRSRRLRDSIAGGHRGG